MRVRNASRSFDAAGRDARREDGRSLRFSLAWRGLPEVTGSMGADIDKPGVAFYAPAILLPLLSARLAVCSLVFKIVEVQHHVSVSAKVAFKPVKRHSHDVAVMHLAPARYVAHLNP